jgi:hypothetical protein
LTDGGQTTMAYYCLREFEPVKIVMIEQKFNENGLIRSSVINIADQPINQSTNQPNQ